MATNISNMLNSRLRLSGLSSGLDVDSIVQQLMRVEQMKVDKVKQEKALLELKRDKYRSVINIVRSFRDEYFDYLKPEKNMRSLASLSAYKTTYNGSDTSSALTATAGTGAIPGSYTISNIQLAQAAKAVSSTAVSDGMQGSSININISNISAANDNNMITVTFNGVSKEIKIDDGLVGIDAVINNLNTKLSEAFGAGKITVGKDGAGDKITFNTDSTNVLSIGYAYNNGYNTILGTSITSPVTLDSQNNKFKISLNGGTEYTIALDEGLYADADAVMAELQEKINQIPELNGKIRVLNQGNYMVLKTIGAAGSATGTLKDADISNGTVIDATNKNLDITVDGVTKTITLDEKSYTRNELLSAIQSKLNAAFGSDKVMVSMDETTNKLRFEGISATDTVTTAKKENGGLEALGYEGSISSNKIDLTKKLSDIAAFFRTDLVAADGDGDTYDIEFTINGKTFGFKSSQTLSEILNTVNGDSEAGVRISYDQLNDKFIVQSKSMGAASKVQISDVAGNGNLMAALGLAGADATGSDATMTFDDGSGAQIITRASNEFTLNGIAFNLKENSAGPIEVKISGDPTKTFELIKGFVDKYNEMISKLNTELNEERYRDYLPLTDEQKDAMNESDIKKWEEKVKSGLLRSDSLLRSLIDRTRETLYKSVEGVSKSLYSIGITTGTWDKKGMLVIDEAKLKDAIANSPDEVMNLFAKQSNIQYSPDMSAEDRALRDSENGIANRIYDVFEDFIRTTRDSSGKKGLLLEKAGITGDISEFSSLISKEIQAKDLLIDTMLQKLIDKENNYYKKFTAMETALNKMNSQSAWLAQQFGGGQ